MGVVKRGFPQYSRPTAKSLFVVPHNRVSRFGIGSTYTVVMYSYKYLFKENNKVNMRFINQDNIRDEDKISLYLRGRYHCSIDR